MRCSRAARLLIWGVAPLAALVAPPSMARACPFCTPVGPSLAARRETADLVLLAEVASSEKTRTRFTIHKTLHTALHSDAQGSPDRLLDLSSAELDSESFQLGDLALLFGRRDDAQPPRRAWSAQRVSELGLGYFVRAPSLREPAPQRLHYFARYLEHRDPLIAEDAYLEFAAAPYNVVAQAAAAIDMSQVRGWLVDESVPDLRKGLYGLLLGLADDEDQKSANRLLLRQLIERQEHLSKSNPGSDFRPGFDGVLGGYLALAGEAGLNEIDREFLLAEDAAEGNLRHVVTALRFAQEYLPSIPRERICQSMRLLLKRPGFTVPAIIDLARWGDRQALSEIVALYEESPVESTAVRNAVVGYLLSIDDEPARAALTGLEARDPAGVIAARRHFERFFGFGSLGAGRAP